MTANVPISAPRVEVGSSQLVSPAAPYNLLHSLDELGSLLLETIARSCWLDAFLVAAGMNQLLQDELQPDRLRLDETARFIGSAGSPLAARARPLVERLAGIAQLAGRAVAAERRLHACVRQLTGIVDTLAAAVAGTLPDATALGCSAARAVESLERLPSGARAAVLRLPACFHDFDQRPDDVARLARDFAAAFPERGRRLLVIGVRTSGSYLAPLHGAFLRNEGFERVDVVTVRPGRRLLRAERHAVGSAVRDRGLALVTDDPPGTGSSVARVVGSLERLGLPAASVVLLLQLFEGQELPPALSRYASVCLPWSEWAVHARLAPPAVAAALAALWGRTVTAGDVSPARSPGAAGRGHAHALLRVRVPDEPERVVLASGVGLGYLSGDASATARALPGFLPEVWGVHDGVLCREWLADERRAETAEVPEEALAAAIAEYVVARAGALPLREDFSLRLTGELPAWEVASNVLSRAFGRAGPAAKLLAVDAAVKRLVRVAQPSLVDGWTGRGEWFVSDPPRRLVKVGFYERSFWHLGLACCDPLYDLAGAAAGRGARFVAALRHAYEERSGAPVDPERFLLYEIAHLWCRRRLHPDEEPSVRAALAAAVRRYVGERFLADAQAAPVGPLCALDLDGVLETEPLGFPATTLAGALALRALLRHGYRPVLASGRSAGDVADRCAGYGLPGGVAEYGGAIVTSGAVRSLLSEEMSAALDRTREELAAEDVRLDPLYRYSVRAYRVDRAGRRRGLDRATVERVLGRSAGAVRAIPGDGQTDFVPVGVDKGTGLGALLAELGPETSLALAVGDTAADLPMLALASRAAAPRHARRALRRSGVRCLRRPHQSGLALAVERLLGHPPGSCPVCRAPRLEPRSELLMSVLSAQERGRLGMLVTALRLPGRTA